MNSNPMPAVTRHTPEAPVSARESQHATTWLQTMLTAQKSLLGQTLLAPEQRKVVERLRDKIPPSILTHFLRLVEHGRPGVAILQHGVCSACHIRAPFGTETLLVGSQDLHVCESCSAFLVLAPDSQTVATTASSAARVRRGRGTQSVVA